MSDGAKAGKPRKPEEDQVEDMAVDEDKTGNSGEEPQAQHLRVNTMEEAPLVRVREADGQLIASMMANAPFKKREFNTHLIVNSMKETTLIIGKGKRSLLHNMINI